MFIGDDVNGKIEYILKEREGGQFVHIMKMSEYTHLNREQISTINKELNN